MQQRVALNAAGFVFGGLLLGCWVYFVLFKVPDVDVDVGPWVFWGVVGLAISGGILAARFAPDRARMAIWVGLGIAVGLLAMAAVFQRVPESMAALLTVSGGALIVTSIPGAVPPEAAWPQQPVPGWQPAEPVAQEPAPMPVKRAKRSK